jgi:hypothetical protein
MLTTTRERCASDIEEARSTTQSSHRQPLRIYFTTLIFGVLQRRLLESSRSERLSARRSGHKQPPHARLCHRVNGYIGAVLAPYLMERGLIVDRYRILPRRLVYMMTAASPPVPTPEQGSAGGRRRSEGCEVAVHLAELSKRPARPEQPPRSRTRSITYRWHWRTALGLGIRRFVIPLVQRLRRGERGMPDETAPLDPQTAYAECKVLERDLQG